MAFKKSKQPKKAGSVIYDIAIIALLAVMALSSWHVYRYYSDSHAQESRYDELAAIVQAAKDSDESTIPSVPAETHILENEPSTEDATQPTEEAPILPEYAALLEMNPDLVGWIEIEGTQINYPVMQSPQDPDFYIDHNFDRQYSARGCIYAEEACNISAPSDNITLYGHHMNDGSMFGTLKYYIDPDHRNKRPYIRFETLTEHHTYEIFAVFKTTATVTKGFPYHNFIDAQDAEVFDDFIEGCLSRSLYDTGIVPQYGDKVICLSTCEYSQVQGRLVVCAVRID